MKEKLYTFGFMLLLTAVFVGILSTVNYFLKDKVKHNQDYARQKVVLGLLAEKNSNLTEAEVIKRFEQEIKIVITPVVYYRPKLDKRNLSIIKIAGLGFWGPISGYLALDFTRKTIQGVNFTLHSETPGLGGRISEKWFTEQFIGKRFDIVDADGKRLLCLPDGSTEKANSFDAITGATETSRAIEKLLNNSINSFLSLETK